MLLVRRGIGFVLAVGSEELADSACRAGIRGCGRLADEVEVIGGQVH